MRKLLTASILIVLFACKKEESAAAVAADVVAAKAPARMIVRSANVRILVADTSRTVAAVTKSAEAAGGFVAASQIWREGGLLRARLTLRVPSAKLTETLAAIRAAAKRVDNETIESSDVSEEYVDLESRVRNLEAAEAELLELLKVARQNAKKAKDVLEVHQEVTNIRGQIEQARGRMRYLSQVSAMSAIDLDVVPDAIAQPVVTPGWQPVVVMKNAGRALVGVLQSLADAAIWLVICFVPIFGILALVAAGMWKVRRLLKA